MVISYLLYTLAYRGQVYNSSDSIAFESLFIFYFLEVTMCDGFLNDSEIIALVCILLKQSVLSLLLLDFFIL